MTVECECISRKLLPNHEIPETYELLIQVKIRSLDLVEEIHVLTNQYGVFPNPEDMEKFSDKRVQRVVFLWLKDYVHSYNDSDTLTS